MRIGNVRELVSGLRRRRTLVMEWIDPPFCSGHWVPDMVDAAGGVDFGSPGRPSRRVRVEEILVYGPEVIVFALLVSRRRRRRGAHLYRWPASATRR